MNRKASLILQILRTCAATTYIGVVLGTSGSGPYRLTEEVWDSPGAHNKGVKRDLLRWPTSCLRKSWPASRPLTPDVLITD